MVDLSINNMGLLEMDWETTIISSVIAIVVAAISGWISAKQSYAKEIQNLYIKNERICMWRFLIYWNICINLRFFYITRKSS